MTIDLHWYFALSDQFQILWLGNTVAEKSHTFYSEFSRSSSFSLSVLQL